MGDSKYQGLGEHYQMLETLRKQGLYYEYLVEQISEQDITQLLKTEADKIRHLCHGYKSIEVSPLVFHYALD